MLHVVTTINERRHFIRFYEECNLIYPFGAVLFIGSSGNSNDCSGGSNDGSGGGNYGNGDGNGIKLYNIKYGVTVSSIMSTDTTSASIKRVLFTLNGKYSRLHTTCGTLPRCVYNCSNVLYTVTFGSFADFIHSTGLWYPLYEEKNDDIVQYYLWKGTVGTDTVSKYVTYPPNILKILRSVDVEAETSLRYNLWLNEVVVCFYSEFKSYSNE